MGHKRAIVLGLLFLLLLVFAGCYTVLRHPTDAEIVADEGPGYKSCSDCHADASYYHPYYQYGWGHDRWGSYRGYPWWYDNYWWYDPYDYPHGEYDGPDVEKGEQRLWGNGGWASGGWGFRKPPSSDSKEPRQESDQQKAPPKKDDKEAEKKKDDRNLFKPRKKGF